MILTLGEDDPTRAAHLGLPTSPVCQHILTALADTKDPQWAQDPCRTLCLHTDPAKVESKRAMLKHLVATSLFALTRPRTDD